MSTETSKSDPLANVRVVCVKMIQRGQGKYVMPGEDVTDQAKDWSGVASLVKRGYLKTEPPMDYTLFYAWQKAAQQRQDEAADAKRRDINPTASEPDADGRVLIEKVNASEEEVPEVDGETYDDSSPEAQQDDQEATRAAETIAKLKALGPHDSPRHLRTVLVEAGIKTHPNASKADLFQARDTFLARL